ncbi:hypothetical protein HUT18_14375 [Streptomyces sp. NA04227]|uniref:hypothetical protein n=1 Tax=Streptomyces sp. NA04227 TaxID=2742136 RepID=UPI00159100B0|nr:hypothetical protein [Streptomyces sp. NA04227]QKW07395.1 hypothetical protein HUT18_14375 [Streptomyces sp. NA04227]
MDAGLAAVLGATVGAVGTGGAAAISALMGRSQTRLQVQAEHDRILRDARRIAYAKLAEALSRSMKAMQQCEFSIRTYKVTPETRRQELRDEVDAESAEAEMLYQALPPHMALVSIEGPVEISLAAAEAHKSLSQYRLAVVRFRHVLLDGESFDSLMVESERRREIAIRKQSDFVFAASRILSGAWVRSVS